MTKLSSFCHLVIRKTSYNEPIITSWGGKMGDTLQKQLEAENEQLLVKITEHYRALETMFGAQMAICVTLRNIMKDYENIIRQQIAAKASSLPPAAQHYLRYFAMEKIASNFTKLPVMMLMYKAGQHTKAMQDASDKKEEKNRWKSYVEEVMVDTCENTNTALPKSNGRTQLELFQHSQKKLMATTHGKEIQLLKMLRNIFSQYTNDNKSMAVGEIFASLERAENQLKQNMNPKTLLSNLKTALKKADDYEQAYYKGRLFGGFEKKSSTFNPLIIEAQAAYDRFSGGMRRRSI